MPRLGWILLLLVARVVGATETDAVWNGGSGPWIDAAAWSGGVVPNDGATQFRVFIDGGKPVASSVTLDVSATVRSLAISPGDELTQTDGHGLTLASGAVVNDGTWRLDSRGSLTDVSFGSGPGLSGAGEIILGDTVHARVYAIGLILTHGAAHTVRGGGQLLVNTGGLFNEGNIVGDGRVPLVIDPSDLGVRSTGRLEAAQGGTLELTAGLFDNAGGVIEAGAGSVVRLTGLARVTKGSLGSVGDGEVRLVQAVLDGVTTYGRLRQADGEGSVAMGGVRNDATWELLSAGSLTDLRCEVGAVLSGEGTIALSSHPNNRVYVFGGTFTQEAAHTLRGGGQLLVNVGGMLNRGQVVAEGSTPLVVDPSDAGLTNEGTLLANGGGTLRLAAGTFRNSVGSIEARAGSSVRLTDGAAVVGGRLGSEGSGQIELLLATLEDVHTTGTLSQGDGGVVQVSGVLRNDARWDLSSAGSLTDVRLAPGATLSGGGTMVAGDYPTNRIYSFGGIFTQDAEHTLRGAGQLLVNVGGMVNRGTVIADRPTPLVVDPSDFGMTNQGTCLATDGGTLELFFGEYRNAGGSIVAEDGSTVRLSSSSIVGGDVKSEGTGKIRVGQATLQDVHTAGTFLQPDGGGAVIVGTLRNDALWELRSAGSFTDVRFEPGAVLDGAGTMTLGDQVNNRLFALGAVFTQESAHTIRGAGQMLVNQGGMVNRGTIAADRPAPLFIDPQDTLGLTNEGRLSSEGVGGMSIGAGAFSTSGEVFVASGSVLTRSGEYVQTAGSTTLAGGRLIATASVRVDGGVLRGIGTLEGGVLNEGQIEPGQSQGTLNVTGSYTQGANGTLRVELAAVGGLVDVGSLQVGGPASLAGRLEVAADPDVRPAVGSRWEILRSAGRVGEFSTVVGLARPDGLLLRLDYSAGGVALEVIREAHTPTATATATPPSPTASPSVSATATGSPAPTASPSPTATASFRPTATPTPTATLTPVPSPTVCIGDCNGNFVVSVDELITLVNIALDLSPISACPAGDANADSQVTVDEIVVAVNNDLLGCEHLR